MEKAKATPLFILLAASLAVTAVFASVFVYYPLNISLTPSKPAVYFVAGSNAGKPDVMYGTDSNTISVSVDSAGAQASITVHPTYQTTYYKDVLEITNQDSQAYYVWLNITNPLLDIYGNLTSAKLIVFDASSGNSITSIDLSQTGPVKVGQISGGATWRIDLEFKITGYGSNGSPSQAPTLSDTSASLNLIYSPSNENPPSP